MQKGQKKYLNYPSKAVFLTAFLWGISIFLVQAQCDFIGGIGGLSLSTPSTADPSSYTQTYVLVDCNDLVYAVSATPDFPSVEAGLYDLRAINYANAEAGAVTPLLAIGQPWEDVESYQTGGGCVDYTPPYGGCALSVCTERNFREDETINVPTAGMNTVAHTQNYCLVCDGTVVAKSGSAVFDLSAIPEAVAGANCQVFAYNYPATDPDPLSISDPWGGTVNPMICANTACLNYAGMRLGLDILLPVTYTKFTAEKVDEQHALLRWETASETNNRGYTVERSAAGTHWDSLGFVVAESNGRSEAAYTFHDYFPLAGKNYYRLKQRDYDGTFSYSPVRYLRFASGNPLAMQLIPNPHQDGFSVHLSGAKSAVATLELIDVTGRTLLRRSAEVYQGNLRTYIETSHLQKGMYLLRVQLGREQISKKCIKK